MTKQPENWTTKDFVEHACAVLWDKANTAQDRAWAQGVRDAVREVTRAVHKGGSE